ncbi:N,N'-diacetylbacillosaminyl-diphospho-undecaprenol alpha-1,3-N-acetylgalactosaminyltransferase [Arenibacter antarcticus]|uniref:Glycosyltransferase family 4 protein n=1 Tax=Arenibacter antarcticus TaxID=2040469 RepID=A0ABW5VFW0_9FLAO|nr:glycosyltransferase family 4 protein [Arenibacter sp. H213]MCM4167324.1 glycosyltransferase family 1 protein [Arenibacter sp. H213]
MYKKISICLVGSEDAHKRIGLAQCLMRDNFEVTILGTKEYDYPEDIQYIGYSLNRKFNPISDVKTIMEYRNILKKNNFDIVQTFDTKPAFILPFAAIGLNTKIIRTITGMGTIFMSNELKFKVYRIFHTIAHFAIRRRVTHTTFQNEDDRGYFLENKLVDLSNSSLIFGSGIDLSNLTNRTKETNDVFTFICVSRLVYEKGIINYLEAAKICKENNYEFKFLLVGPLEEASKRLNLEILEKYSKVVDWLGPRADIKELMLSADAFVLPTFREGFSRVLLEASALGLPSITTNVPGTNEIIRHLKEGLHVEVDNSEDLANAMIRLAMDRPLAKQMGDKAKLHVKQFSLNVISGKYIELYKKAI